MEEAWRILKPGGRIVVMDLLKHRFEEAREMYADVWLGFSQVELTELLREAGFQAVRASCGPPRGGSSALRDDARDRREARADFQTRCVSGRQVRTARLMSSGAIACSAARRARSTNSPSEANRSAAICPGLSRVSNSLPVSTK